MAAYVVLSTNCSSVAYYFTAAMYCPESGMSYIAAGLYQSKSRCRLCIVTFYVRRTANAVKAGDFLVSCYRRIGKSKLTPEHNVSE